jgi:tellurite resistance protein TehA-like permease
MWLGIDFVKLLSIGYWFESAPGELSPGFERFFLIILFLCYLLYGIARYKNYQKVQQKDFVQANFWQKFGLCFLTLGITQTFLFFFRYEAIPVLGGRFWFIFWFVGGLIWVIYLTYYYFKVVPRKSVEIQNLKKFKQYLPRKKK